MESILKIVIFLSMVCTVFSIATIFPSFRPYTIPPFSKISSASNRKDLHSGRLVRSIQLVQDTKEALRFPIEFEQVKREKRAWGKTADYRPREHGTPRPMHPTYKVPQTTQRTYHF